MNNIVKLVFAAAIASLVMGCGDKNAQTSNTVAGAAAPTATQQAQPAAATPEEILAIYQQGLNYRDGKNGVTQDLPKAFELFTKASEAGNRDAMFFLGVMYERGESVDADSQKALEWYTKSADLGCGSAVANLKKLKEKLAKKK